ncbi:olfactory receptor 2G3-like [Heterocephalus glaber]|uniref:Olfactory receptor 2G3-like n=1 Tax=Heterocephalus glaber TaxID=10181 RepID=A0AAX6QGW3_HETGA|nr:olfactory receptor 2G3-like [Heterocephalus glaber]
MQAYLFNWNACAECILLTIVAIDCYVTICQLLQYTLIMHPWVCVQMAAASWSSSLTNALLQATFALHLPLCGHHSLDHFCEISVLIKLACRNTTANEQALSIGAIPFGMVAPLIVVISYTLIGRTVLKPPSTEGRQKALSTCSSHLLVVTMYFGGGIYMYFQTPGKSTQAKFLSVLYCVITPVLKPLIYTLRNQDVKRALKRILQSPSGMKCIKPR